MAPINRSVLDTRLRGYDGIVCGDALHAITRTKARAAALTPPKIVIKYNYSAQEVIYAHGKRLHRRCGSIRPAQDRADGRGADRGPQPPGQAQCAERRDRKSTRLNS